MIILGIDPGVATTGYGVIESNGNDFRMLEVGVIETSKESLLSDRLSSIADGIELLLKRFPIDSVAIERLFFAKNVTSGIEVGHARGVVLLSAARAGLESYSYTPAEIKQSVCGQGNAGKEQVGKMVAKLLGLTDVPRPDDAADGLAVALCHAFRLPFAAATSDQSART